MKQLAARPGLENGYPLGPVESVEVTWDPPAASTQPADQVQSAELDISVLLTEGVVETTAKIRLRGLAREWKVVAPATASLSADRASGAADIGPAQTPTLTKPNSANKLEWKIEFPAGSSPADWIVTAVTRQARPKTDDPKHRGPFAIGPYTVLDVLRQTGTVRVSAGPHTRFVFKHGPDLRRGDAPGPPEEEVSSAFFRLTTGPTGATAVNAPLLTVEAWRLLGRVAVKPTYKLTLTDAGWKVRAEVKVSPIGTEIDGLAVDIPTDWRGLEASPAELVEAIQPGTSSEAFWTSVGRHLSGEARLPVLVRFAAGHKQPFDLILTATVPIESDATEVSVPLPRFPGASEREATITATVPDGLEVRGEARGWEGESAARWGSALTPASALGGKSGKAVTAVTGRSDSGIARATLIWQIHRPDLTADVRADVALYDRQLVVQQVVKLRSNDGLPRSIRFHGPPTAAGVKVQAAQSPLEPLGPGEWNLTVPVDAKEFTLTVSFAIPLPPHAPDEHDAWAVPVGLLWPSSATRSETTVRVWSNTVSSRAISSRSAGLRELPIEPVADRDALPVLALASTGSEIPLVLEASEVEDVSAVAGWVDRALIQAWSAEDGATRYRARFLLRRWLAPSVELRLPSPLAGPTPEFLRDGLKIEAVPGTDADGERMFRVPLPEPRPGRTTIVEVRYQLPAGRGREYAYQPPRLPSAAFVGALRWQVTVPPGFVPLLIDGASPEMGWRWRGGGVAPVAAGSPEELEQWLRAGEEQVVR